MENKKYLAWLICCPSDQVFNKMILTRNLLIDNSMRKSLSGQTLVGWCQLPLPIESTTL